MKLSKLNPNKGNPRTISQDKIGKLKKSIKGFEKMMELRPIVVNRDYTILGGNMRYHALKELGYTEIPESWVKVADDITPEQEREFVIKDNVKALICPIQFPSAIYAERQKKNGNRIHHHIKNKYLMPRLIKVESGGNIAWDTYPEDYPFTNEPKRYYGTQNQIHT